MFTGWPSLTHRSSSTGPVVNASLSSKYFFALAALGILSLVAIRFLLFQTLCLLARSSGFDVQIAFEACLFVCAVAERLVGRLPAAAQPGLVPVDRDLATAFGHDLDLAFDVIRTIVLGCDHHVGHGPPPCVNEGSLRLLLRIPFLKTIPARCTSRYGSSHTSDSSCKSTT